MITSDALVYSKALTREERKLFLFERVLFMMP